MGFHRLTFSWILALALWVVPEPVLKGYATPESLTEPPSVDFQAVLNRDALKRGNTFNVFLFVTNKSDALVRKPKLLFFGTGFDGNMPTLKELGPYEAAEGLTATLRAEDKLDFGQHRIVFVLRYSWTRNGKSGVSALPVTTVVQVNRQFEEEAKGLPGGTPALLYLLLPIMPAILAYGLVESKRKGEGFKVPQFKTEYIVPAFFAGMVLSFLMLNAARQDESYAYANPTRFAWTLIVSATAGALIPGTRLAWRHLLWHRYAFAEDDKVSDYVRKALRKSKDGKFQWVKGTAGGNALEGLLLRQPDDTTVLGAAIQVSPEMDKGDRDALKQAVTETGSVLDRKRLFKLLKKDKLKADFQRRIQLGGEGLDTFVRLDGLDGFTPDEGKSELCPLVTPRY